MLVCPVTISSEDTFWMFPESMAVARSHTAFLHSIIDVVLLSAYEKMVRSDTGRVVTVMKYEEPFWDRPYEKLVGNAMSAR